MNTKKTIAIVDDHQLVAQGISRFFESMSDVEVIGVYESPSEAIPRIKASRPDIVLSDLDMPGMNGLEMIQQLRKEGLKSKFVLLTMHLNQSVVKKAMDLKLEGYLPKNADQIDFQNCIEAVLGGKTYYSQKAMEALINTSKEIKNTGLKKTQSLTEREREILTLIAEGLSTKGVAEKLFIAVRTVETHRKSIMEKLAVHNVAGMVRIAVQEGLV